jgi:hypothetical protein
LRGEFPPLAIFEISVRFYIAAKVGYTSTSAEQGKFLILGAGFEDMNGTMKLNDLVSGVVGVDFGDGTEFKSTAAQVQIPVSSGNGYNIYYYLNDGWYDNGTTDGDFRPGWCDGFGSIVDATIPAAQGFWTKGVSGAFTLEFNK